MISAEAKTSEIGLTDYDKREFKKIISRGLEHHLTIPKTIDEIFSSLPPLDDYVPDGDFGKMRYVVNKNEFEMVCDYFSKLLDLGIIDKMEGIEKCIADFRNAKVQNNSMSEIIKKRVSCHEIVGQYINEYYDIIISAIEICKMVYTKYPDTQINTFIILAMSQFDTKLSNITDELLYQNTIIDINNARYVFSKIIMEYYDYFDNLMQRYWKELEEIDFIG